MLLISIFYLKQPTNDAVFCSFRPILFSQTVSTLLDDNLLLQNFSGFQVSQWYLKEASCTFQGCFLFPSLVSRLEDIFFCSEISPSNQATFLAADINCVCLFVCVYLEYMLSLATGSTLEARGCGSLTSIRLPDAATAKKSIVLELVEGKVEQHKMCT